MKNPTKITLKTEIFPLLLIIVAVIASFFFYAKFPDMVATHWNFQGEPDSFSGKAFAAFFFPALIFGIYILFLLLPIMDPKRKRYEQFAQVYRIFRNIMIFFMIFIYFITGFVNMGYDLNIGVWIASAVGVLFIIIGNYMGKIKNNWFMGIRTPWTLSSEEVWNKTHRFGGKIFMASGVIMIITGYAPFILRPWLLGLSVLLAVISPVTYSYLAYLKEKKNKNE